MSVDDLVQQLRAEAAEAASWPVPGMEQLRRARARRRGRRAVLGGLATAVAAAAVAAAVVVPRAVSGVAGPAPVGPAASPTAGPGPAYAGTRAWEATSCPGRRQRSAEGRARANPCALPQLLTVDGRTLWNPQGGSVPTHHRAVRSADLRLSVARGHAPAWVLVGASGSGSRSDLAVRFGKGRWQALRPGRLTLLRVPDGPDRLVEVLVRERARPLPREVLRVGVYRVRRSGSSH